MKHLPAREVHRDARGQLVPLELNDVAFEPRRIFVVQGPDHRVTRGGHSAGSQQVLTLISGRADVRVRTATGEWLNANLVAGDSVELEADDWIDYDLVDPHSVLLVVASEPYARAEGGGVS